MRLLDFFNTMYYCGRSCEQGNSCYAATKYPEEYSFCLTRGLVVEGIAPTQVKITAKGNQLYRQLQGDYT